MRRTTWCVSPSKKWFRKDRIKRYICRCICNIRKIRRSLHSWLRGRLVGQPKTLAGRDSTNLKVMKNTSLQKSSQATISKFRIWNHLKKDTTWSTSKRILKFRLSANTSTCLKCRKPLVRLWMRKMITFFARATTPYIRIHTTIKINKWNLLMN